MAQPPRSPRPPRGKRPSRSDAAPGRTDARPGRTTRGRGRPDPREAAIIDDAPRGKDRRAPRKATGDRTGGTLAPRPPRGATQAEERPRGRGRPADAAARPERPARPERGERRAAPGGPRKIAAKPAAKSPEKSAAPAAPARIPAPVDPDRKGERIAKLLARAGVASRREVERLIEAGRVKLGEEVITTPATILTSLRGLTVDDKPVAYTEITRLFAFHKPSGLITAERDPAGRPTIYTALRNALPPGTGRMMPVGRLDLNTEGLLMLTNDGELKRAMELPAMGIPRTYRARTFGDISQARLEELMEGIEVDGVRYGRIDANMERRTGRNQWIELTLTEGKNREVRRVLEALGLQVSRLLRVAYGPFHLGDLPRGAAVEIRAVEVERFRNGLKPLPPHSNAAKDKPRDPAK